MAERALRCEALACSKQNGGSAGRVRSVCWNGMVEAFLNSGTTKTRRQRNGQPRGRWRIRTLEVWGRSQTPPCLASRGRQGGRGYDKISFTPPK